MILIDYNDKRPIYEQVVDRFQTLIINGALEPNEKIPSVRSLAIQLSINPNTIQRAYTELEREGFIYSIKGRGNFVRMDDLLREKQKEKCLEELRQRVQICQNLGIEKKQVLSKVFDVYGEGE